LRLGDEREGATALENWRTLKEQTACSNAAFQAVAESLNTLEGEKTLGIRKEGALPPVGSL